MPKKVRKTLSVDESLQRYFYCLQKSLNKQQYARWRLATVVQDKGDYDEVLQVIEVLDSGNGIYIKVR